VSDLKRLIQREIRASATQGRIRGTVITAPQLKTFDATGRTAPTFVSDVDIGAAQVLRDVPVKINGPKARFYAQAGSSVYLDRNAQGRYQIVAPADRVTQQGNITDVDEATNLSEPGGNVGNTIVREPYVYYRGEGPEELFDPAADPDVLVWVRAYDRALGLPAGILVASDADGADVLQLTAKAPTTVSFVAAVNPPVYRRFDPLYLVTARSSVDFDGVTDRMDASANVVEGSPGELSVFVLLNKDAAGAGADAVLELSNFRLLSRQAAADRWAIDVGAGVEDSGATIGTSPTLIEMVAADYNSVALYQDGTLLTTITTAAAGLGLGASSLGYSAAAAAGTHNGRIAEVLVLDRTVSGAERLAIEAYFARTAFQAFSRWGTAGYPKITVLNANGREI